MEATTTEATPTTITDNREPPDDYMRLVFDNGGLIAGAIDGYAMRPPQVDLARGVHDALMSRSHLVAEAPTGTGKSLAYAVPASWWAAKHSKRVLICTANIALQEQLVKKDLPLLQEILPWRLRFALAKGRSNYLCPMQHEKNADTIAAMPDVLDWIRDTEDGDLTGLANYLHEHNGLDVFGQLKPMLGCTSDDCLGRDCSYYETQCYANQAKARAEDTEIVVSNYHLLFAHLKVMQMTEGMVGVLPQFDAIVWDEAHKAADIAREFFGDRITYVGVRNVGTRLGIDGRQSLIATATRFFDRLVEYAQSPANDPRMRVPMPEHLWRPLHDELIAARRVYERRADELVGVDQKRSKEFGGYARRADRMAARLEDCCTLADEDSVYFCDLRLQRGRPPRATLNSKVINVAPLLNALVWSQCEASVQTSATLSVSGSFSYQLRETGVPELDSKTLLVDTPFNFREQCVLVVPEHLPEAGGKTRIAWEAAAVDEIGDIVSTVGGRTLCLFTTYKMLKRVAETLPRVLERNGLGHVEVLVQGEAALRTKLVEQFRADETSVLLGTESFWAGVDVPGRSLSCVVIDKFPFPPPNDPIMDAFQEQLGRECFRKHSIPRAVIQFKQGFGRLVRRDDDHGLVVFLDKRLKTKNYGRSFLRSLPDVRHARRVTAELVAEQIGEV